MWRIWWNSADLTNLTVFNIQNGKYICVMDQRNFFFSLASVCSPQFIRVLFTSVERSPLIYILWPISCHSSQRKPGSSPRVVLVRCVVGKVASQLLLHLSVSVRCYLVEPVGTFITCPWFTCGVSLR
jgi:hypothetical protein